MGHHRAEGVDVARALGEWAFVLCRTDRSAPKHKGLSYLLVPLDQPGVDIRPIRQISGASEFNEVFFDGARTAVANTVGEPGDGWKVANGTLAFERGASTLGQQLEFGNHLSAVLDRSPRERQDRRSRHARPPRGRLVAAPHHAADHAAASSSATSAELSPEAMITKLYWATWHRELGNLAMDVLGPEAMVWSEGAPTVRRRLKPLHQLFLFSRADTIYAGSNQIQRNIIGERALGLPREPRP